MPIINSRVELNLTDTANATQFTFPRESDDITFYLPKAKFCKQAKCDHSVPLRITSETVVTTREGSINGRLLACDCWFSKSEKPWISCTVRVKIASRKSPIGNALETLPIPARPKMISFDGLLPWSNDPAKTANGFAFSLREMAETLGNIVFKNGNNAGLIVVAGATSSGKSKIAQAMIAHYLVNVSTGKSKRLPHIVTLEDPIEDFLFEDPIQAQKCGLNYTARLRANTENEQPNLNNAVDDALRQTPKIFYVSETRNDDDWVELLRMAGTGHLVITTTHANTVAECVRRILVAMKADQPPRRGEVAQRLNAVIQLTPVSITLEGHEHDVNALLPAVWRNTTRSVSMLVADGLDSLLPSRVRQNDGFCGSLGRTHIVKLLKDTSRLSEHAFNNLRTTPRNTIETLKAIFWESLELEALKLDELGL